VVQYFPDFGFYREFVQTVLSIEKMEQVPSIIEHVLKLMHNKSFFIKDLDDEEKSKITCFPDFIIENNGIIYFQSSLDFLHSVEDLLYLDDEIYNVTLNFKVKPGNITKMQFYV
jgi:hypothetical protein